MSIMAYRTSSSRITTNSALRAIRRRIFSADIFECKTRPTPAAWSSVLFDGHHCSPSQKSGSIATPRTSCSVRGGLFCASSSSFGLSHCRCFAAQAGVSSKVVSVEDDDHYANVMKQIKGKETLAVAYFTAQWCGPCKQIAPYIDQLSREYDDVTILKIDIDKTELAETMKESYVGAVPTFHFYKKGEKVGELTGAIKDKLGQLVKSLRSK